MARSSRTRFAVCIDNSGYPVSLELHKIYRVVPDQEAEEDGDIRVIDESGEDYLYEAELFLPVDLPAKIVRALNRSFARSQAEATLTQRPASCRTGRLTRARADLG
jgi:hypothetical protein